MNQFVYFSNSGCFLPLLLTVNLFFGWMFLKPLHWLIVEAVLLFLFIINGVAISKKMSSRKQRKENVIDVEGRVIKDKEK